jgi:gliding motility-associated-like protein
LWSNGQTGHSINVSSAGSYTVTVTDVNGCAATSTAKVVTANPLPATPAISGATTFCAGGGTTLTSSLSPGTYAWSNGQTTQSITVSTAGPVSVTVTDPNGCSATSVAKNIVVNSLPATPVIAGSSAICAGSSTTLTSSAPTGNSWSTGASAQTILASAAGAYSVTVTDVNGCTATSLPFIVTVNPLPATPSISGNNAFCAGSSTTLTSTPANSYRWNTGATTRSLTVTNAGGYSVTVTDANGCSATSSASTVVVNPLPVLQVNNPLAVCAPATVDITNAAITAGSTPGISLSYFLNAAASNALAVPSAVAVSGTYYIRGVIQQTGCSAVAPVNVAINAAPVLSITNPPAVCAPATVDLTAASIVSGSAAGLSYSYWTDAATTKTLTSPAAVAVSGIYYIKAIAAGGCSAALPVVVTVGTRPVGTLNNPAVNFICEGTVLQLTTQSNAARYQWFKDQSAIVNATGATYDAAASGNYTVEFISQEGCVTEAGNTIRLDLIQKPLLQFASTPGCEGTATSFVNQSTATASGGISWLWNFGDGSSSNTFSASHVYAAGGQYMVTLTANNASCPSLTDTRQSLVVIPVAQAGTRYSTINAIAQEPFTLSARSFGAAYSWQPVFGLSQPTKQVTTGVLNADTTYTVRITTVAGCVTTDTVTVKVTLLGEIYVPQAFSPNGDGQNDRLYPNLVAIVKLNYFRIFNRWGNLVFQSADPTPANGWDGKLGGIAQAPGTFTWVAEGVDGAGNIIRRSGSTVLIK